MFRNVITFSTALVILFLLAGCSGESDATPWEMSSNDQLEHEDIEITHRLIRKYFGSTEAFSKEMTTRLEQKRLENHQTYWSREEVLDVMLDLYKDHMSRVDYMTMKRLSEKRKAL